MENMENSNTTKLHLWGENIALGAFPPISLELPYPAAGVLTHLGPIRILSHQGILSIGKLLVSLALGIPHENELLKGQGDGSIHVSLSEHLGLFSSL